MFYSTLTTLREGADFSVNSTKADSLSCPLWPALPSVCVHTSAPQLVKRAHRPATLSHEEERNIQWARGNVIMQKPTSGYL